MSPHSLKARIGQLETKAWSTSRLPAIRIIQDGALTEEQAGIVADAEETGRLVIIRQIVRTAWQN